MNIIEAQVLDDRHLKLTQSLALPPGSRIFITISSSEDQIQIMERESWTKLSAQKLEGAYGEDEPEYSLSLVKQPNPEYQL